MAENNQRQRTRMDVEARPKLVGTQAFKKSLSDLGGDLIEPGILLAAGATKSQAAWAALRGILLTRVLGPLGLITGAVLGIGLAMRSVVARTGLLGRGLAESMNMERLVTQFRPLLGGIQAARNRMAELFQFAATTPFQINGIAEASRQLEILTRGALSTQAGLRLVGDAAAIAGVPLEDLSFHVGRLYDGLKAGQGGGRSLLALQQMGVISGSTRRQVELLGESGANFRGVWALVEKELQRNKGGMEMLSQTAAGLETTLADVRAQMARSFGDNFLQNEKESIRAAINITQAFTPVVAELGRNIAAVTAPARTLSNTIKQSETLMRALAEATMIAMRAFLVFGTAVLAAQLTLAARGLLLVYQQAKTLGGALKLLAVSNFSLVRAKQAATSASILNARAMKLEAAAAASASAAYKQKALALALANRQKAANLAGTATLGGAMAATTMKGKIMAMMFATMSKVLAFFGGLIKGAFAALLTGVGGAVAAVTALAVTFLLVNRSIRDHRRYLQDMRDAQRQMREEAQRQAQAIRTVEDRMEAERKRVEDLKKAYEVLREAKDKAGRFRNNREGIEQAEEGVRQAQNELDNVRNMDVTARDSDNERIREQLDYQRRLNDAIFQGEMARATGDERRVLMMQRQEELAKRILDAENLRAKTEEDNDRKSQLEMEADSLSQALRRDGGKNLITDEQRRAWIRERNQAQREGRVPDQSLDPVRALINRQKELREELAQMSDDSIAQLTDPEFQRVNMDLSEINSLRQALADIEQEITTLGDEQERAIRLAEKTAQISEVSAKAALAAAEGRWDELSALTQQSRELEQQLQLERRIRDLRNDGMNEAQAQRVAQQEEDARNREREAKEQEFRRARALEIQVAEARAGRRPREARALEDQERLRSLTRDNIEQGGMSAEDAKAMALRQIRAEIGGQEQDRGHNVVADQFQRLGLGGFAAGSDPAQRARERMVELQKQTVKALQEMLTEGGPL